MRRAQSRLLDFFTFHERAQAMRRWLPFIVALSYPFFLPFHNFGIYI